MDIKDGAILLGAVTVGSIIGAYIGIAQENSYDKAEKLATESAIQYTINSIFDSCIISREKSN